MDPSQPPEGEWFCYICKARRDPQPKRGRGLFADLLTNLDKKNPIAFNLPYEVREYFEGVKTGEEGEYEEATTSKSRSRIGHDEVPDYFKLKDSKGNCVLCFRCGKSAMGRREIIACDFCNLQWHIDCLDPPLANPPPRGSNGKPRHDWMCPNHIDDELQAFDTSVRISRRSQAGIGGSRKVRRPKNARIIDTALRRGFVNNGNIEIQNEPFDVDKFIEREEFGVVYRVPERGVKLDFIDRVRRSHVEAQHALAQVGAQNAGNYAPAASPIVASAEAHQEAFHKRPFADRQVALNLAQMAHSNEELSVSTDQIENLVSALIAEAPTAVVDMFSTHGENTTSCDDDITTTNPTILPTPQKPQESDLSEKGISAAEKQQLLVIQELIRRRLGPAVKAES
ncbi:hypothetical protein MMC09_006157 [Bachmanniomyces sp. S44760]|nr:hypothetical protein [Bachmanniomyces sp. S44760]